MLKTATKMTAVTASTKRESPKMESAGVEAGEKILVGLRAEPGFCPKHALGKNRPGRVVSKTRLNLI